MGRMLEEILANRDIFIYLLKDLSFVINLKKSVLKLSQIQIKICNSNIHKRIIKYRNSLADRQQYCIFISLLNVGHIQKRALAHQQVHLDLCSQQTNCTVCKVQYQCSECKCRLRVTKR